jgi:V8-like Glu-specific endopeptidase
MKFKHLLLTIACTGLAYYGLSQDTTQKAAPDTYPFAAPGDTSRGIFGEDDRKDVTDAVGYAGYTRATAVMVNKKLVKNGKIYGYSLKELLQKRFGNYPIDPSVKFLDQPTCASCTGFLIGPDLLMTAGHCIEDENDLKNNVWVFDYTKRLYHSKSGRYVNVPSTAIYRGKELVASKFGSVSTRIDYAIIRLDRETDREPYRFRTSGTVPFYSPVYMIGAPTGLPLKLADNAYVVYNKDSRYFKNSLDGFPGNSGGPVFNKYGFIEGIHVRGAVELSGGKYTGDYKYDQECNCIKNVEWSSTYGNAGSHAHKVTSVPQEILHMAIYENIEYAIRKDDMSRLKKWLIYSWMLDHEYTKRRGRLEMVAARANNQEALEMILAKSTADIKATDADGKNLLYFAILNKNADMLNYLLKNGVSPNKADKYGSTALFWAVREYNPEAVKILLSKGANPNVKNTYGSYVIHEAVRTNNMEIIRELIKNGADLSVKNADGWTPKKMAKKLKFKSLKKYLKKEEKKQK